ncbi:hypothetical protein SLEP1_g22491 [Rubroshorea leprosula]|uniref:Uncharacterized protein n=1 Tax=Rubroshorea leprosula TaxID=152421 RepID=A0AAV5JFH1_9ROSI|nr:hypothetical protein SLEP1_g22491 [Rubroshorea leprosula]
MQERKAEMSMYFYCLNRLGKVNINYLKMNLQLRIEIELLTT